MQKRKLILLFSLLCLALLSNAQQIRKNYYRLSGTVLNADSQSPVPRATIEIYPIKHTVIADDNGKFSIRLKKGNYLLEVSSVGYANSLQNITLSQDLDIISSLKTSAVEQESVVVTSSASAMSSKRNPQPIEVVTKNKLLQTSSTNIIDALSKIVPGIASVSTGPAISKPFIRGLGYNRVLTVNDGVRQEGQQWGDEHGIEIDDYSAQKIEVLKGPASLMYGSDAIAGVINISSQNIAPEGHIISNIISEYQTNNGMRGFYGNIAGNKNGWAFNAYGTYKGAHDYKNKYDGYVFNSKFYNKNFGGMLAKTGDWGYSKLLISNFNQYIGMVEGERDEATGSFVKMLPGGNETLATQEDFDKIKPFVPYQHIDHFKAILDNKFYIDNNAVDLILGWQRNQRREFGNADATQSPDAYFDLKTFTYTARYHMKDINHWKSSIGINGMQQSNTNRADEVLIPDYHLFDFGIFAITQYTKDKWTLSGGVRFDTRHINGKEMQDEENPTETKFAAFTRNFSNISASAGLSYAMSNTTTVKLNVAKAFRAPNLAELASNGAHEGTNRFEIGDRTLKSENSLQTDLGVEFSTAHVNLGVSLFYNYISDFIFYEKLQNVSESDSLMQGEDGQNLYVFKFAQQNAHLFGGEAHIDIHPHPIDWLHISNTVSYTRGQFAQAYDGSKNIPNIPAAVWQMQLRGNWLPEGKSARNLYASIESNYTFRQNNAFTGYNTETATDAYWLVNAGLGVDIATKGKTLFQLSINANNIGDIAYQNHLNRLKYLPVNNATGRTGVFDMGRNYSVKINIPLAWRW